MSFGTYIKKLRHDNGYTIAQVVEMAGDRLDKTTISRTERDERKPSLIMALLLSEIYGVDFKDLTIKSCGKVKIKKLKK